MLLTACLLTACGGKKKEETYDDGLPVLTLALRSGIYSDVIRESVLNFEEREKVHCKILELSEDELHSGIADDAANEKGAYDLCMVDGSWMADFTDKGVLTDLSGLGYELDEDIIPATTEVCYYDGSVYLAPYYGNVTVLLFNKSIIQRAGYDASQLTSLEDVLAVCEQAKKDGNFGFMYRGDSANNYVVDFLPVLSSFGGWVVDEDLQPTVNTPEFKEAMEFYLKLIATGKAENRDNLVMAIANNAAAVAVGWPGWYTPDQNSAADYRALTGKVKSDSTAYNANVYGIWTLGIPSNATQKELSVKLLEYLMDADVQKATVSYGGVPCRYSSLTDEGILQKYPQYEAVRSALESGIYRPIMVEWPQFYEILGEEMGNIIEGKKNIETGLQDAQTRLDEMLHTKE